METKNNLETFWFESIQDFLLSLDGLYMIFFLLILYGVENSINFKWVRDRMKEPLRAWVVGGILAVVDMLFTFVKACELEGYDFYNVLKTYIIVVILHDYVFRLIQKKFMKNKKSKEDENSEETSEW